MRAESDRFRLPSFTALRVYTLRFMDLHGAQHMDEATIEHEPLMTPDEVAEQLAISVETVNSWRVSGRPQPLPFVRVGPKLARYRPADVREFIAANLHAA